MAAHSENSIRIHKAKCKGRLKLKVVNKKKLGKHKLFTCDSCDYVGRAGPYTPKAKAEPEKADKAPVASSASVEAKKSK